MRERDAISYNTMISAQIRIKRNAFEPLRLYSQMLADGVKPNNITFSSLLVASDGMKESHFVEQIHAQSIKFGLNSDEFVGSAMVNGYERCRGLKEALCAFEEIAELDSVSFNIMIDVCARRGSKWLAMDIFSRMRREGNGSFDSFTLTSVLKTCLERGDLRLGMQLHGCAWKAGLVSDAPIGNALITMYSKCGGGMDSMVAAFRRVLEPNIISWTAMIAGLVQNGLAEEAASFYKEMVTSDVMENEFCFASVLRAFSFLASLEHGRMVHSRIVKSVFSLDVMVGNALVDLYFKCGSLEDARLVFETMRSPDVVCWTVMILGLGQHGKGREALKIFGAMESKGFKPDAITFLAALSACSHGGLVDDGLRIFNSMVNHYGIKPKREHCACVVDMLGRSGRLKEAERFIGEMGMEMDPLAWEALLGACGIYGEMELGQRSAEKLIKLEPQKDGPYVLLSNIYAERRMWEEKESLRERLNASGLRKEPARSWFSGLEVGTL
ncbi:pentatricopeptide repeat-containing protein [Cocos nucifera]|uniref:Pentatricopeptide repeat-containing protein n=1 Tax=Cocos nucifera TaxID=13894 RepID=A0A8K0I2W2_COCNU|nr:pentatricopeptide repeat-containing protein [Cocos nucifera]